MSEELLGHVTHWYGRIGVAGIRIDSGVLHVGDTVHVVGHTSDTVQRVDSIEIDHRQVGEAHTGDDIGVRFSEHVREHDRVFVIH